MINLRPLHKYLKTQHFTDGHNENGSKPTKERRLGHKNRSERRILSHIDSSEAQKISCVSDDEIFITQSSYSANVNMVNDNTSDGITFDGIYRIETDIISDVTDEENTKETEVK